MTSRTNILVGLALAALVGACGSETEATCEATVPASCPADAPTYSGDVAPLMATYCSKCHATGGVEADRPLTTHAEVVELKAGVQQQLSTCAMPPADESNQPTTAERDRILAWLVCGAQDN